MLLLLQLLEESAQSRQCAHSRLKGWCSQTGTQRSDFHDDFQLLLYAGVLLDGLCCSVDGCCQLISSMAYICKMLQLHIDADWLVSTFAV